MMTPLPSPGIDWDRTPAGLDTIAADLRALRTAAGEPSYAHIGRLVAARRAARGVPDHERRIPRTTLYNCFRDGRRRIDVDAVTEIALALGLSEADQPRWAARVRLARAAADGAAIAEVRESVPSPVPFFSGREAELTRIRNRDAGSAMWISGLPGAGKTQLVLSAIGQTPALFLDLRGYHAESPPVNPTAARRAIMRSLLVEEGSADDVSAEDVAAALRCDGRWLVLDDASDFRQVVAIVGDSPTCDVLVTSRAPLSGEPGWHHLPLQGMDRTEVTALLSQVTDEPVGNEVQRLVDMTGGLPLAVALVAGRLTRHQGWTLAEHVDLLATRLASGRIGDDLRAELDLSYDGLSSRARQLLRSFADVPLAELGQEHATILLNTDAAPAGAELVASGLAIRRPGGGIALHSLVRAYGQQRAEETDPPRLRAAAFTRLGQHFAKRVWAAYATIVADLQDTPRRTRFEYPRLDWDASEATSWLRTHLSVLLTIAHASGERGEPQILFRISEGLSLWLNLTGQHTEALRLHEAAADLAVEVGDADALAMASLDAGQLLVMGDRPEEARAHFARATRLVSNTDELSDPGLAGVLDNMSALVDLRRGRLDQAATALRRAVALHQELDEIPRFLSASVNLAVVLHTRGDFDHEAEVLEQGLVQARRTGSTMFETNLLINRADLHLKQANYACATADTQRAIDLAHEVGSPYLAASARMVAAEVLAAEGRLDDAVAEAEQALQQARDIGSSMVLTQMLITLARLQTARGSLQEARLLLAEAESGLGEDDDLVWHGRLHRVRADLDPGQRRHHLQRALTAFEAGGSFHAAEIRDLLSSQ